MRTEYKERDAYKSSIIFLTSFAVLFAVVSIFVSDVFVPVSAAFLSVLFLSERRGVRKFSMLSAALLLILNLGSFLLAHFTNLTVYGISGIQIIFMAFLLFLMFGKNRPKSETVFVLIAACALCYAVSLWFFAADMTGSFSIGGAIEFYKEFIYALKETFVESVNSITSQMPEGALSEIYSEEAAAELADSVIRMLPGIFILVLFATVGIMCKIFSFAVYKVTGNNRIFEWKFFTSNLLAYFYCVLFVIYVIFASGTGIFATVVINLFTVFLFVYAYFGFGFLSALLSMRRSRGFAWSVLIVAFIILGVFAALILSFAGVVFTVLYNKHRKIKNGLDNNRI